MSQQVFESDREADAFALIVLALMLDEATPDEAPAIEEAIAELRQSLKDEQAKGEAA